MSIWVEDGGPIITRQRTRMSQGLEVNNKMYLPSVVLAKQIGYTSDYISKLARDEKILGTRVGRQWYVEPESLRMYIHQLEVEKKIAKEDLSLKRKLERTDRANNDGYKTESALIVSGKALVVVFCGCMIGGLSLLSVIYDLSTSDLVRGSQIITHEVAQRVSVGIYSVLPEPAHEIKSVANPVFSGTAIVHTHLEGVGPQFQTDGVYTVFPEVPFATSTELTVVAAASTTAMIANLSFSDEVLFEEREGVVGVRPIFKNSEGQLYELSATVVETSQ